MKDKQNTNEKRYKQEGTKKPYKSSEYVKLRVITDFDLEKL